MALLPQIILVVKQSVLEGSSVLSKNRPPGKVPSLSSPVPMPSADTSMFAIMLTCILSEGLQVTPSSVSVEFADLDNYLHARLLQPELEAYLAEDLALGHLAKVHVSQVVSPLHVHPIALVPKPGQPGKFRLITDISSLAGTSVNNLTPPPPPFRIVKVRNLF
jgi:hypothetical protein